MKVFKDVKIKGEIFYEYAFLTYEFTIDSEAEGKNLEYIFALPEGSLLSDMRIIERDGKIIKAKVASAAYVSQIKEVKNAAVLRKLGTGGTYHLSIGDVKSDARVKINLYVGLKRNNGKAELSIPLAAGVNCGVVNDVNNFAEIELNLMCGSDIEAFSETHNILFDKNHKKITTEKIKRDRDFKLVLTGIKQKNSIVVSDNGLKAEALCRIVPSLDFFQRCKVTERKPIFIFDNASLYGGALKAAKEFVLYVSDFIKTDFSLIYIKNGKMKSVDVSKKADAEITSVLSEIKNDNGNIADAFEYVAKSVNVLPIAVMSDMSYDTEIAESISDIFNGMELVVFGAVVGRNNMAKVVKDKGGRITCIFEMTDIKKTAYEFVKDMNFYANDIHVEAEGAEFAEVLELPRVTGGEICAYIDYGKSFCGGSINVCVGDYCERVVFEKAEKYDTFKPIGLVYADIISKKAEAQILSCTEEEVQNLRRLLEAAGVRYCALNSETAYIAELDGKPSTIRVILEDKAVCGYTVFEDRTSMFGEETKELSTKTVLMCANIILKSMRSDGAVCAVGITDPLIRKKQTVLCILVLIAAGYTDANGVYVKKAEKFLGGFSDGNLKFTRDINEAFKMLETVFDGNIDREIGVMPDLYTAARVIYLSKRQNIKVFAKTLD